MTQTASPLQRGKYPPFLPYNFYEAPQYAAYRPIAAITPPQLSYAAAIGSQAESTTSTPVTTAARPAGRKPEWESKVRAQEIRGWLDNLHLLHENYVTAKGTADTKGFSRRPAVEHAAVTAPVALLPMQRTRGRPKKVVKNRLKPYLRDFIFAREALQVLSGFDDIVHGAVRLDAGGNTRPLSKTMMVFLLQVLDEITAEAVQEDIKCSLRHAQRIAMCLRVIELTAYKHAQKHWHAPSEAGWSNLD